MAFIFLFCEMDVIDLFEEGRKRENDMVLSWQINILIILLVVIIIQYNN